MVVYETVTINDKQFIKSYSDAGYFILGGSPIGLYEDALDLASLHREYTESDIRIDDDEATIDDYRAELERLGVEL